jgi:RNA polymerase sigma-70 factor (ECF subfamily)
MDIAAVANHVSQTADFETAVAEHYPALVRRLALVIGDPEEARDIAQAACLRAYRGWSRFDGRDVRAWLYTIGLRLAFNELRRRGRRAVLPWASEPTVWQPEVEVDLWEALRRLEPKPRAALILHIVDGFSHTEVGNILGVPTGTAASWISRTKGRLRIELDQEDRTNG